jgi:hypothetical protein
MWATRHCPKIHISPIPNQSARITFSKFDAGRTYISVRTMLDMGHYTDCAHGEKLRAPSGFCRQYLLATRGVALEAWHTTRCVRRSHTHQRIPVPNTTVPSRQRNAQNRTPTCRSPFSGAYTWRKPFPCPLRTGRNRQLQCHANDMACVRWTLTGKTRSLYPRTLHPDFRLSRG